MSTGFIIATRNNHKVGEIRDILGSAHRYWTLADLPPVPAVIEDAPTFSGNASKKSIELARWLIANKALPKDFPVDCGFALADDSGLEVDALNGAPGVHSARFASLDKGADGNSSDADNNAKLLRLLHDVPIEKRGGRFRCVIALTPISTKTTATQLFDGVCEGRIDFGPRGKGGFGYDPLFIPNGFEQSFAELGAETKNRLSHRAAALSKLRSWLTGSALT